MRIKPRWRGTLLAAACVAAFYAVFYGMYLRGNDSAKFWLWVFGIGAIIGGGISFIDSLCQIANQRKQRVTTNKSDGEGTAE